MDHSGVSDGQANLFSSPDNQAKAIQVLTFLTRTFTSVPNVVGIQLLNEPVNDPRTFEFYSAALEAVRAVSQEAQKFPFYVHDAFNLNEAVGFMKGRGTEWNILDHHSCELRPLHVVVHMPGVIGILINQSLDYVFTPEDRAKPAVSHILDVTRNGAVGQQLLEAGKTLNGNFIVGEWSCALADTSLLGESDPDGARRQFCEIQSETYRDVGGGTHFWSK
jgi:glucan 1,3-beta-glucosidase